MLTVDEAWLNHAARLNARGTVLPEDVWLEDMLFALEGLLEQAKRDFVPETRPPAGADPSPSRGPSHRWRFVGTQPR
jgi:hypothetical protein